MKKILLLSLFSIIGFCTQAQEYKVAHSGGKLVINDVDGVKITGYSGSEIVFKGDSDQDEKDNERARGLKLFNSKGLDDNTGLGISVKKENGNVIVEKVGNVCSCEIEIQLPSTMGIEYNHSNYNGDDVYISDVSGEIVISAMYNDIKLHNVTGPMAVKSVYGSVLANFKTMTQDGSITLHSIYDYVDASFPPAGKYDVNIKVPYGNIYSDVDISVNTTGKGMRQISGSSLDGTVNGGGIEVVLKSSYENVYLRKK